MTTCIARGPRHRLRISARLGAVAATVAVLLTVAASTAFAHVTVNPKTATAGSYTALTFRVPTESDTASTVSIAVTLPTDHPFPSVSARQMPGWTATMTKVTLDPPVTEGRFTLEEAVSTVTWTADDGVGIKPGEFAEFALSVGPVPDVPAITFPSAQTYSDGTVVDWDEISDDGGSEPEHPAPVLTVAAADAAPSSAATDGAGPDPSSSGTTDTTAQVLGLAALILAAIALLVAVAGRRRAPVAEAPGTEAAEPSADEGEN